MQNSIYAFGEHGLSASAAARLLGIKGATLSHMSSLGVPVPPGFTITTVACKRMSKKRIPTTLCKEIDASIALLSEQTGAAFGSATAPLLVSVRSGASVSMPGMMDTLLNVGMNDAVARQLAQNTNDSRFAYDTYRRFLHAFGDIVLKIPAQEFTQAYDLVVKRSRVERRSSAQLTSWRSSSGGSSCSLVPTLSIPVLYAVVDAYKRVISRCTGKPFPQDPWAQLHLAIAAIGASWHNPRAVAYRKWHRIPHDVGTAVTVQLMVFGNMGKNSGAGVCFTRDPNTGAKTLFGEYAPGAQGDDVVGGTYTPSPLLTLRKTNPARYTQLAAVAERLEREHRDMQDIEFTVQQRVLYITQTRSGKRSPRAAARIAVDFVREGRITQAECLKRVSPEQHSQLLLGHNRVATGIRPFAKGLPASAGVASGPLVLGGGSSRSTQRPILVLHDANPGSVEHMRGAAGIVCISGGVTSHVVLVARERSIPCIVGCAELRIDARSRSVMASSACVRVGETVTLNGASGKIYQGTPRIVSAPLHETVRTFLQWSARFRRHATRQRKSVLVRKKKSS